MRAVAWWLKRRWTRVLFTIALGLGIVAVVSVGETAAEPSWQRPTLEEAGLAGLCGATCEQLYACNRTDVPPPACDPWGFETCADFVSVDYNPGGVAIQSAHYYGECTKYHAASGTMVLCSIGTWWTEGNWISLTMCSGSPPTACVGALPPLMCQTCKLDPNLNPNPYLSWIRNEECSYDERCCEPLGGDPG